MQNEVFDLQNTNNYEEQSYGKFAYKRVRRLRRKGKRRGIEVPYLNYELAKPEKPRIAFWVIAAVSAILLVGIIIGLGFLYNYLIKTLTIFNGIGDVFTAVFDPAAFVLSNGLSAIPTIMVVVAYILLFCAFLLPLGAVIYLYRFVRDTLYMAKCSKEEFAKGGIVCSRIFGLIAGLAVVTVILVVILTQTKANIGLILAVYFGIVVVLGGLLAPTIIEKIKCSKWFESLDENKRQNYLAHERALQRVKRRLNFEKRMWNDLGK